MPEIANWQRELGASLRIALVSEGTVKDNRAKNAAHEAVLVLLQREREVADAYQAWGTPAALIVTPDGAIGSRVAQGADAIRALVAHSVREAHGLPSALQARNGKNGSASGTGANLSGIKIGDPAPALKFRDLSGKRLALADFRGGNTLVLFWNPSCGFCQQMVGTLKAWETDRPSGAPTLLVISTGTVAENRAMNLRSPVVFDHDSRAGAAFGANGTPMGILIDAGGRIASELAAGAPAVMALAVTKSHIPERPDKGAQHLGASA